MAKRNSDRKWRKLRASILAQSTTCWLCGYPGADTVDHVLEVVLGGAQYDPANLRPAHGRKTPLPDGTVCKGNSSRGATLGNRLRAGTASTPSRRWGAS